MLKKILNWLKDYPIVGWLVLLFSAGTILRLITYTYRSLTAREGEEGFTFDGLIEAAFGFKFTSDDGEDNRTVTLAARALGLAS